MTWDITSISPHTPQWGCLVLSCRVGVLANTPGGVKWSELGAHVCWVIIHVSKLVKHVVVQEY